MRLLLPLLLLLFILLLPNFSMGADHSIHIEWGYTPPSAPPVSGFELYQEGTPVCDTDNPDATAMDCDVSLDKETTNFTLTALFTDGSESPHSAPFPFTVEQEEPVTPVIPVAPPIILNITAGNITVSH